jgi:hypothetical protein
MTLRVCYKNSEQMKSNCKKKNQTKTHLLFEATAAVVDVTLR